MIAVRPPEGATFAAEDNVIVGNTVLYGAVGGRGVLPRPRGRALRRAQLRRERRRRGCRRPRLRVHDRRTRRRARADRAELRRGHERRDRLRARRRRDVRDALQPRAGRARAARGGRRRDDPVAGREAPRPHRLAGRRPGARRVGAAPAALRQGHAARLQARARRARTGRSPVDDHPVSSGGEGFLTTESESAQAAV